MLSMGCPDLHDLLSHIAGQIESQIAGQSMLMLHDVKMFLVGSACAMSPATS